MGWLMLTTEERSELTMVAFLGFDILRAEQPETNHLPCWLCCDDETKEEAKQKALDFLNANAVAPIPFTEDTAETHLQSMLGTLGPSYERWVQAEEAMKQQREDGNPRAYFT